MVLTIFYPLNEAEYYAKGTASNGVYYEVPAIFNADGECDTAATKAKVIQFIDNLSKSAA